MKHTYPTAIRLVSQGQVNLNPLLRTNLMSPIINKPLKPQQIVKALKY
jgi:hypothetical protein